MSRPMRVVQTYQRVYEAPISFQTGDLLHVDREDPEQPGWFWCSGPDGREGWVRGDALSGTSGQIRATHDYSALELSVNSGDTGEALEAFGGWWRCRLPDGQEGWIPAACIEIQP